MIAIPAPDRVVVMTKTFPVVLGLAHVAVPDDDATRAKAQAKLTELMKGKKCSILYTDAFGTGQWLKLGDVFARATNRVEVITDPNWTTNRFYRLVVPQQP